MTEVIAKAFAIVPKSQKTVDQAETDVAQCLLAKESFVVRVDDQILEGIGAMKHPVITPDAQKFYGERSETAFNFVDRQDHRIDARKFPENFCQRRVGLGRGLVQHHEQVDIGHTGTRAAAHRTAVLDT